MNKSCIGREEIKRAYEYWKDALIKNDLSALDKLHTDHFSWTNSMGITRNKIEYLYKLSSGSVKFLSLKDEDVEIIVEHDSAIVKARGNLNMVVYGQMVCAVRDIIVTFQFQNSKWLLSRIEETKIAA